MSRKNLFARGSIGRIVFSINFFKYRLTLIKEEDWRGDE